MGTAPSDAELDALWSRHSAEWRDTAQIASTWQDAVSVDPNLLDYRVAGDWWEVLDSHAITLLVTREYEHLILAMQADGRQRRITMQPMPHPSGLTVDRERGVVHVASTRNPNQVYDLVPVTGLVPRLDLKGASLADRPLVPVRSRFYPGSLYMHDLAMIGGELHANSVGQNAVVRLTPDGQAERVWWPRCIEREDGPVFGQNHLQLNSIAAGADVASSYFSASTDRISARRPGHKDFPVDRRGVIFSGGTREVCCRGLTRPHSARLNQGQVWVDNSGYGEVGVADRGQFAPAFRLPGWTRGLCFHDGVAFVGTSRVIPRFRQYAPGLDVDSSVCALHAVEVATGKLLGTLSWPYGNQIFAVEWVTRGFATGFPFATSGKRATAREKALFYAFNTSHATGGHV